MSADNVKCGGRKRVLEPINQSARNPAKPDEIVRVQQFVPCPGCADCTTPDGKCDGSGKINWHEHVHLRYCGGCENCTPPLPSSRVSEERLRELAHGPRHRAPMFVEMEGMAAELLSLRTALASAREALVLAAKSLNCETLVVDTRRDLKAAATLRALLTLLATQKEPTP